VIRVVAGSWAAHSNEGVTAFPESAPLEPATSAAARARVVAQMVDGHVVAESSTGERTEGARQAVAFALRRCVGPSIAQFFPVTKLRLSEAACLLLYAVEFPTKVPARRKRPPSGKRACRVNPER
jgi:hypothetical protein